MLAKLLPAFFKRAIKTHIRIIASGGSELYVRSLPGENAYSIKPSKTTAKLPEGVRLPIPPKELWLGYGSDAQAYISGGERHVTGMKRPLKANGYDFGCAKNVL